MIPASKPIGFVRVSVAQRFRISFVCTGNICRSPLAEALARAHAENAGLAGRFHFESFGTHGYHVGEGADPRTLATARQRGVDLGAHRARRIAVDDCLQADLILAMDRGHESCLRRLAPDRLEQRIRLYLPWLAMDEGPDVPDPYYGEAEGFAAVHRLLDTAAARLAERLPALLSRGDG